MTEELSWICTRCGQAHYNRDTLTCVNIKCKKPRGDFRPPVIYAPFNNDERNKFIHKYGDKVLEG